MTAAVQTLDKTFHALANPTRRAVVDRLGRGPATVSELAEPFEMALPSFLQHLRVLEASGLVQSQKRGRVRTVRIRPKQLKRAANWLAEQREIWERRLDQLDAYVNTLEEEMTDRPEVNPALDLVLERVVEVRPELVWKAWTEPEHLMRWFTPAPWETIACEIDLRPGGLFSATMRSPEGQVIPPEPGCYLEVVENRKLVFTDALGPGYRPRKEPFFTAVILLQPEGAGTRYTAIAMHADEEAKRKHEEMGFHEGWGKALDQLVELAGEL